MVCSPIGASRPPRHTPADRRPPPPAARSELKKIIDLDANNAVRSEAIAASAAMAKGLKRDYTRPALTLFPILAEKLKDKSSVVHALVHDTMTAYHTHCFSLMDVADDLTSEL